MNGIALFCASIGSGQIIGDVVFGIFLGAVIVFAGFTDRERVKNALILRDRELILTFLWGVLAALIFCRIGVNMNWLSLSPTTSYTFGASLLGGIICGIGFFLVRYSPLSAICAAVGGRLSAFCALVGMIAGVLVYQKFGVDFVRLVNRWDIHLGRAICDRDFFSSSNPAFWIIFVLTALIIIISFALRKQK